VTKRRSNSEVKTRIQGTRSWVSHALPQDHLAGERGDEEPKA
jgi:hypothetical protein